MQARDGLWACVCVYVIALYMCDKTVCFYSGIPDEIWWLVVANMVIVVVVPKKCGVVAMLEGSVVPMWRATQSNCLDVNGGDVRISADAPVSRLNELQRQRDNEVLVAHDWLTEWTWWDANVWFLSMCNHMTLSSTLLALLMQPGSQYLCLCRIATGSGYKMIWTCVTMLK